MNSKHITFEDNLREHFSKTSMICNFHVMRETMDGRKCLCSLTKKLCNTYNCPRIHEEREERGYRGERYYEDRENDS